MNKLIIAAAVTGMLSACSSTRDNTVNSGGSVNPGTQQAISEQRLSSDFKRQGVKIIYSFTGSIEAIETTGYAPVWGNSQNAAREAFRVAELEAKKSLNDFINKEVITSSTSVTMISRNLEKARDNKTNNFTSNRGRDNVMAEITDDSVTTGDTNREENVAVRNDALTIASRVQTNIRINNQGILGGLYLVEGNVINDGKNVRVVYRWDQKHTKSRLQVRNLMAQ